MDTFNVGRVMSRLPISGTESIKMLQSSQKAERWQAIASTLVPLLSPAYPIESPEMRPVTKIKILGLRLAVVVLAAYWLLIFVGTHHPSTLDPSPSLINDKVKHFGAFFMLGTLLCYVTTSSRWFRRFVTIGIAGMAYAAVDEWSQRFVPGRYPDVMDFVADTAGLWTAIGIYVAAKYGYELSRRSSQPV